MCPLQTIVTMEIPCEFCALEKLFSLNEVPCEFCALEKQFSLCLSFFLVDSHIRVIWPSISLTMYHELLQNQCCIRFFFYNKNAHVVHQIYEV